MNNTLSSELSEYKDTTLLLSQLQVRLKSVLSEVETMVKTLEVLTQLEKEEVFDWKATSTHFKPWEINTKLSGKGVELSEQASKALFFAFSGLLRDSKQSELQLAQKAYEEYVEALYPKVEYPLPHHHPMPSFENLTEIQKQYWIKEANK